MVNDSTINVLKEVIRRLEAEIGELERQRDGLVMAVRHLENLGHASTAPRQRTEKSMRDAMAEILAEEGPLGRREIHDRLVNRGVYVGGRDPVNNVGAHLSIDPRFENVGRGMWDLASSSGGSSETERSGDGAELDGVGEALESGRDRDESEEEEDGVAW